MLVGTNVANNCPQHVMEYMYYCCIACHMQHNISCNDKTVHKANSTKND